MFKRQHDKKRGGFRILFVALAPIFFILRFVFRVIFFMLFAIDIERDNPAIIKAMLCVYGAITFLAIVLILLVIIY